MPRDTHKPPLVMLHGLTGSGACWTPVARLVENDFDVVTPDARGHGKLSAPSRSYRYDDLAGDVIALVRERRLDAPYLLGHSMGGMTAAVVASQMGTALRGVILVDPTFLEPDRQREVFESDVAAQHRRMLAMSKAEIVADARRRHPYRSQEIIELLAEARLQTQTDAFDVLTPPSPDYRRLVSTIVVPTLIVAGEASAGAVVSHGMANELKALSRHLRVEHIPGAGHGLPYDHAERLATVIRSFTASAA